MQKEIHTYFISVCCQYLLAWSFSLTCHGIIVELKGYCACRLSLTVSFCQLSKWNTNLLLELATDKSKLVVAQCKGSRNQGSFLLGESRIQEILFVGSEILGFGIRSTALVMRLPLKIGIRNPRSTNKAPEASTLNPKSNVWNPESKTALDPFHWAVVALWACYCIHV